MSGKKRRRMHGGGKGSGAPTGKRNGRYTTGLHTREVIDARREIMGWVRLVKKMEEQTRQ